VWSADFVFDRTAEGRVLNCLTIVDDAPTEAVAVVPARSPGGLPVTRLFEALALTRGVTLRLTQPGKPSPNAYIESFNGRFRDECVSERWFKSLAHAQVVIETWRRDPRSCRTSGLTRTQVDLRQGVDVVTFSLEGFQSTRRGELELQTNLTAQVNGELHVDSQQEAVTASGPAERRSSIMRAVRQTVAKCYTATMRLAFIAGAVCLVIGAATTLLLAQRSDAFNDQITHPAIGYMTRPTRDAVVRLNEALRRGTTRLTFDPRAGYLPSVLAAAHIPVASQLLVFSQTSAQGEQISLANPRALFFADDIAVGWVRGTEVLEVAAVDPEQGPIFYTLEQKPTETPQFKRDNSCLLCHDIWETHGVPGLQVLSTFPMADERAYASGRVTDHRTPFSERWGGWFVTGRSVPSYNLGNQPVVRPTPNSPIAAPVLSSVDGQFELSGYPSRTSDVVALMVLEHQTFVTNLMTWLGWESRVAAMAPARDAPGAAERIATVAHDLVDALLFVDESPLLRPVAGNSGFAEQFVASGAKDRHGRSLREFDLQHRLFKYRCSYMIESRQFNALPAAARRAVYMRLWQILSGAETTSDYRTLTKEDRQAVADILRDTRTDLPPEFGVVVH